MMTEPADLQPVRTSTRPVSASRQMWERRRKAMEQSEGDFSPLGFRARKGAAVLNGAIALFGKLLSLTPLFRRGYRNAHTVELRDLELTFDGLPASFDGYRILHLTDLHIDATEDLPSAIVRAVRGTDVDLCVMTGDYRFGHEGDHRPILDAMQRVLSGIGARDGTIAILGNHDDHSMARSFEEELGIRVLVNERVRIGRGNASISVSGTDDVNSFYTEDAKTTLTDPVDGFGIALVHSPEMADEAEEGGHDLYLCGHTHGGQIALPNKRPLITHLHRNHDLAAGLWQRGRMHGYTGPGTGFSGLPLRFNTTGEATLITLRSRTWLPR